MTTQNHSSEVGCIPLSKGAYTILDAIDADLAERNWHSLCNSDKPDYAGGWKKGQHQRMHRVILERILGRPLAKGENCDHVNGDGLDNRRANLRPATQAQNMKNRKRAKRYNNPLRGAYPEKRTGRWFSHIDNNGKTYHLGTFDTAEAAHEAYCEAAKRLHGEFAKLN